jgi:hypothetical protein
MGSSGDVKTRIENAIAPTIPAILILLSIKN